VVSCGVSMSSCVQRRISRRLLRPATGQLPSSTEAGHLADLRDEHRGQDWPHPRNSLDRDIARVPAGAITGQSDQLDLPVEAFDHSVGVSRSEPGMPVSAWFAPASSARQHQTGRSSLPAPQRRPAPRAPGISYWSAARPAWPDAAPAPVTPGSAVGQSMPRTASPSAADPPDPPRHAHV
jgi:hypothetical protein